jgi:hypothetical protein
MEIGEEGDDDGEFKKPIGFARGSSAAYITEEGNDRVTILNLDGSFRDTFGDEGNGNGEFKNPKGIFVDSSNTVYVVDEENNRVQIFDSDGNYLDQFGTNGNGNGVFGKPRDISIDASGVIYVTDADNNRVQIFDSDGNYLDQFGSDGNGNGEFKKPAGIVIGSGSGGVWSTFSDGSGTGTSTTVTGLTNGIEYEFRVFAVNAMGTSVASNTPTATPQVGVTVPSTPTNLAGIPGDAQVILSWAAPSDGGAAISDYSIQYRATSVSVGSGETAICHAPPGNPSNTQTLVISDSAVATHLSHGDSIGGFDGQFKSNFIFQDNSYSTSIENTGYYSMYDLLEEQYHSTMIVEVANDPISDARLLEKPTMPYDHTATKLVSGSSSGVFALDVSLAGTIRVFGDVYDVDTRQAALLDITQPDGTVTSLKLSTGNDGHFSTIQSIPDSWEDGLYIVSFGVTQEHISSIYFKLASGKILPLFTPSTSVVASAENVVEISTSELTLLHTATLGHGGNLLIAEGQVDSSYSRILVSIENPDNTVDEFELILNDRNKYSLPLIKENWMVGDYTVTVTDESTEFTSETFTIFEVEKTKSALELAFESSKADAPVSLNNVVTEVILLDSDYFEQIDEFSGESEFGTITVTRPDTKIAQSTLSISGTVYSTSLETLSGLVEIIFTRPSGDIEELTTVLTKDGKFETILVESWVSGDYTLHASHEGNTISELTFFVGDKSSDGSSAASTTQCQDVNCVSVDSEDKVLSSPIMIMIDGDFENVDSDISIDVKLIRPDNTSVELSTTLSASGEFKSPLVHSEEWISGVYTVIVSYHGDQLSAASFRK